MVITLNRPDKLNAYTGAMGSAIEDAFRRADVDDNVRAIIVTGSGRAFRAGADVSGGAASFDTSGQHGAGVFGNRLAGGGPRSGSGFVDAIFRCRKPSIAAINGPAVGIGITMTLPMDVRIAAKGAKIGFIFARRGLVPEAGSAWFLPKLVGLPQALRWAISGRIFGADEALSGGLVSEPTEPADLLARAKEIARTDFRDIGGFRRAHAADALAFRRRTDPFGLLAIDGAISRERGSHPMFARASRRFWKNDRRRFPEKSPAICPANIPGGRKN